MSGDFMIPQWEMDIINSKFKKYVYVIEWLSPDEKVLGEVTLDVVDGNVNFDGTGNNRRSCSITLKNLNREYIPSPTSKMWINNKFRLKAGYEYDDGKRLLYSQGIFLLGNPSILSSPERKEVTIEGLDKWVLLDGTIQGELKNKLIIEVDTRVDTAIRTLIKDFAGETKYIIDTCDVLLPYTIEKEAGTPISDVIKEICDIVSYEAFYDNNGYFVFRKALKPQDYNSTPPSWYYTTEGLYLESNRDINWTDLRNSIKVIGMTKSNGIVIEATAQDLTGSELSIDKIGERFKLIEDDNIPTVELAQERADWELLQHIMIAERVRTSIVPNFSHVVGDVINVTDINNGTNGNYVIQNIDYNFGHDSTMNLDLWKIRDWRSTT